MVEQVALRTIADRFSVSKTALVRHKADHLPAALTQAKEAADTARAIDVMAELRRCFDRINKLFDACDAWLTDPDDPASYTLEPRADEISVVYLEQGEDGKPVTRKAKLATMLGRLKESGFSVVRWESKHADPRDLILKTADRLQGNLELVAKLLGELDERPRINVLVAPEWLQARRTLVEALHQYPEARAAVSGALVALEVPGAGH